MKAALLVLGLLIGASGVAAPPAVARSIVDMPALSGRVVDGAGLLTAADRSALADRLAAYEKQTRHQLVLVTVRSLGGQSIEAFGLRLANRWGVGRRGFNDGVLIIVAPAERRTRIEVGSGIEARLTNRICQRIIAEKMVPRFAVGDFGGGLKAGSAAVIAALP